MIIKEDTLVGDIVRKDYTTSKLFSNYGIDFCCNGQQTIGEACTKAGQDANALISELEFMLMQEDRQSAYLDSLNPDDLCNYIVGYHHKYIRENAPIIQKNLNKTCEAHGQMHPELLDVKNLFDQTCTNLYEHMNKEELLLFPYIKKMARHAIENLNKPEEFGDVNKAIRSMMDEHSTEGDRFSEISRITSGYSVPEDACPTYEVSYKALKDFENDLHQHIHLENNILFPKTLALEKNLLKSS